MKVKDFIGQFSHNNEMYVENKDNFMMYFHFNETCNTVDKVMDWYLPLSDIADVDVIEIKQVLRDDGHTGAITLKIDTDRKDIFADKSKATKAPLWFENKVLGTNKEGCCCG